jgi:hypothetical protein
MKRALIDMISNQNNQLNGGFIDQSVEDYVEKIYKNAHLQLYIIQGNLTGFIAYYQENSHYVNIYRNILSYNLVKTNIVFILIMLYLYIK